VADCINFCDSVLTRKAFCRGGGWSARRRPGARPDRDTPAALDPLLRERAGLIARGRRQVTILDRQGLLGNLANVISWSDRVSFLTSPKHTHEKRTRAKSVIYITDTSPQRGHNGGW
jgi:hypothetical protein